MKAICTGIYLLIILSFTKQTWCKKPHTNKQQAIWRVECELGLVLDPECPVDGGWASWGPWSACRGACDDTGLRRRTRLCANPPPMRDGAPCRGSDEEIVACHITNCTLDDFRSLIVGDVARLDALHQLTAAPALAERCLRMECPYEDIKAALAVDNTWQLDPETIWNCLQCVKHNTGCPVAGGWGAWGLWSACSAGCGHGSRWRLRRCDAPPPSAAILLCTGSPLHAEDCEGDHCASEGYDAPNATGGSWGEWGAWSSCSERCGQGVRRRRRACSEWQTSLSIGTWGTHCRGAHDQLEVCKARECVLVGGWSGWGPWGPCSQTCGAGQRTRNRACTRPVRSGGGQPCVGPRTEIAACNSHPCEARTHVVALLNGEGYVTYNFENRHSTLFHSYIRFMPLAAHGTLVRRGVQSADASFIRLSLHRWRLCVEASGPEKRCAMARICSPHVLDPGTWHNVLTTVTGDGVLLRIDNVDALKGTFPCDPELTEETFNVYVGERFNGELQEVIVNFIPLNLKIEKKPSDMGSYVFPYAATNIAYEQANIEEAFLTLEDGHYMLQPCFNCQDEWQLELTLRPTHHSGLLLLLRDDRSQNILTLALQNSRIKVKLAVGDNRSEATSSTESVPGEWLTLTSSKKKGTNTIEVTLNGGEHLHVSTGDDLMRSRRHLSRMKSGKQHKHSFTTIGTITAAQSEQCNIDNSTVTDTVEQITPFFICDEEFYIGGVPLNIKKELANDFPSFAGVIASLRINGELQDLLEASVERQHNAIAQVSSRTASVSGSYSEVAWGKSGQLNLTCFHGRRKRSPESAHWLYLDRSIQQGSTRRKPFRSIEDGRVLRLVATTNKSLRGFYTCRARDARQTRNVITYGVIGYAPKRMRSPDTITAIAACTSLILVITTLTWLIWEGINDLRNGYGFFRDRNLSPEEEAEAICAFIDLNYEQVGSRSAIKLAKARAREKAKQATMMQNGDLLKDKSPVIIQPMERLAEVTDSDASELSSLRAIKDSTVEHTAQIYRYEHSYTSSPLQESHVMQSINRRISSDSTCLLTSPISQSFRSIRPKKIFAQRQSAPRSPTANPGELNRPVGQMLPIDSSKEIAQSPGKMILQKFQQLYTDD